MTANALYLEATRSGDLSPAAPLAALYPVSTVILAMVVDLERLRVLQVCGLGPVWSRWFWSVGCNRCRPHRSDRSGGNRSCEDHDVRNC